MHGPSLRENRLEPNPINEHSRAIYFAIGRLSWSSSRPSGFVHCWSVIQTGLSISSYLLAQS